MAGKHISHFPNKTAEILAEADLCNDTYHNNIKSTAKQLVESNRSQWTYYTQGISGNCLWVHPFGEDQEYIRPKLENKKDWNSQFCSLCGKPYKHPFDECNC